jgi:hypothetical protein
MSIFKFLAAALVALPLQVAAWCDNWTTTDTVLTVAAGAVIVADWGQTLNIVRRPDEFREANPILPHYPTRGQVNQHFMAQIVVHSMVACALPANYRKIYVAGVALHGATLVFNNNRIGLKVSF